MSEANATEPPSSPQEKQCRICLDGEDHELGKLIRPCLCKGSISYVHVKCLQRWRNTSPNRSAFYSCPQCGYHYHFARTKVVGIATNPVVIGALSAIVFTILVICSSYITTFLLYDDDYADSFFFISPWTMYRMVVKTTVRALNPRELEAKLLTYATPKVSAGPPGLFRRFIHRFLLGLPVVGAGAVVSMLSSMPFGFTWFRWRSRRNNTNGRDVATIIIVVMILVGAARTLYKVYKLTERVVGRVLLRAEEAILEVN
ncbi:hypothetical protein QCA50_001954 [Cerrena zonata]|uniref:RING-CH-type domain-containing protein n=1 Tax=Cerrena zonata TaxID=2478898 RepID=A0AAW0GPX9_9APHY